MRVVLFVFRVQLSVRQWHVCLRLLVDRVSVALVILVWQAQIFACIYLWQRINKCRKRRPNMRFMEIANPEDQLALWKLVSDKMWAAFAQPVPQPDSTQGPQSSTLKGRVANPANPVARPTTKTSHKASAKSKTKAVKPKRAPMAPAPKPLPKPNPQQVTSTQAAVPPTRPARFIPLMVVVPETIATFITRSGSSATYAVMPEVVSTVPAVVAGKY